MATVLDVFRLGEHACWTITILAALVLLLYRAYIFPTFISPLRNVPGPPRRDPLFGHALDGIGAPEACAPMHDWVKQYGPIVRYFGILGEEKLLLLSPQALEQIFLTSCADFARPTFLRRIISLFAGCGLLTMSGNEHKRLRRALSPAYSISNLSEQTGGYYAAIEDLVQIWNSELNTNTSGTIEVYPWMGKLTLQILCSTAFGYHRDTLRDDALALAYAQVTAIQSMRTMAGLVALVAIPGFTALARSEWGYRNRWVFRALPGAWGREVETLVDGMHHIRSITAEMLREKRTELAGAVSPIEKPARRGRDVLSLLLRFRCTKSDSGQLDGMSDDQALEHILTFLSAGHDSVASGLSFTLWLLANDPTSQERLREEILPAYKLSSRPDYRTLKSLTWLDCVVNESLRVLPPILMTARVSVKATCVDGVFVPEGTVITCPIHVINTSHAVWGEDAEKFRPGRWLEPLPESYNSTYSHFSFIAGPHGCIGRTMALNEMKAVLFVLIANYEFAPAYEGQILHTDAAITMKPTDGMPLRVTRVGAADQFT
ncbi:hypothetical protein MKEN_00551200 [Mycena kentingensis (nom. inval.)]|nr:hypothetical protein MKEN_00551200 [Mycena kentingensis (nom. inval.)]